MSHIGTHVIHLGHIPDLGIGEMRFSVAEMTSEKPD